MKFTKEQLREKLTGLLTNDGKKPLRMSSRTLSEQADLFYDLLDNEDTELDDFAGKILPAFNSVNSNVEHDVSSAIAELRKKETPDPKPQPKKQEDNPPALQNEDALAKMQEQIASLVRERDEERAKSAVAAKRNELKQFLFGKNIRNGEWIDGTLDVISIGADTDVEKLGENLVRLYNSQMAGTNPITPETSGGGNGNGGYDYSKVVNIIKGQRGENV